MPVKNVLFVLDFDGVIIDSLDEVILVAYAANTGDIHHTPSELSSSYVNLFKKFRPFVQPAGDFLPFARWCLGAAPNEPLSKTTYQEILRREVSSEATRRQIFFETRAQLKQKMGRSWLELHRPYQPLWDSLKTCTRPWCILTNKNREAVLELLAAFGCRFDNERLFSGETGRSKVENLEQMKKLYPDSRLMIVDDSIFNLLELSGDRSLATWGYTTPADIQEAKASGLKLLSQDQLVSLLNVWNG